MSTVLEGAEPFRTVFSYALMRDEKGEEMHKSKGNAIWFEEAAERMGVDSMRWAVRPAQPRRQPQLRVRQRRRGAAPVHHTVVERILLLRHLLQHRQVRPGGGRAAVRRAGGAGPVDTVRAEQHGRRGDRRARRLRAGPGDPQGGAAHRAPVQLVRQAQQATLLEGRGPGRGRGGGRRRRQARRLRHPLRVPGDHRQAAGPVHPVRHGVDVPEPRRPRSRRRRERPSRLLPRRRPRR